MSRAPSQKRTAMANRAWAALRELSWHMQESERMLTGERQTRPGGMTYQDLEVLTTRLEGTLRAWLGDSQRAARMQFLRACELAAKEWRDDDAGESAGRVFERAWIPLDTTSEPPHWPAPHASPMPPAAAIELGIAGFRRTRGARGGENQLELLARAIEVAGFGPVSEETLRSDLKEARAMSKGGSPP